MPEWEVDGVELLQGDCLELMKGIPDNSIDMVLCDLPYGTTRNTIHWKPSARGLPVSRTSCSTSGTTSTAAGIRTGTRRKFCAGMAGREHIRAYYPIG